MLSAFPARAGESDVYSAGHLRCLWPKQALKISYHFVQIFAEGVVHPANGEVHGDVVTIELNGDTSERGGHQTEQRLHDVQDGLIFGH